MKAFLPAWALVVLSVVSVTVLYCDISDRTATVHGA
jgi:hypothetical protein